MGALIEQHSLGCVAPAMQMQIDSGMDEAMVFIGFFEVLSESPSAPSLRLRLPVLPSLLFSDRGARAHPPAQCAASTGPAIRSAHAITEELHAVAQSASAHARAHTRTQPIPLGRRMRQGAAKCRRGHWSPPPLPRY